MSRVIRCALIQASFDLRVEEPLDHLKQAAIEKHLRYIEKAAADNAKVVCLQELFCGPYFCAEQDRRWYRAAEPVPDGPVTTLMQEVARKYSIVLVVPVYEEDGAGIYYNTAAVIDADGKHLGKYRKTHIPHCLPAFWEKFYFKPGNLGYPVFRTAYAEVGVYICYDRHFPEGARALGLNGAEVVFNPSATTANHADHLWKLEQRAHAVANGYFVGAVNRVGRELPWNVGQFFGMSYFCDPTGKILAEGNSTSDEIVIANLDLDLIVEVREYWAFYRDRRPETYAILSDPMK